MISEPLTDLLKYHTDRVDDIEFKEYINKEVLVHNLMMGGIKALV